MTELLRCLILEKLQCKWNFLSLACDFLTMTFVELAGISGYWYIYFLPPTLSPSLAVFCSLACFNTDPGDVVQAGLTIAPVFLQPPRARSSLCTAPASSSQPRHEPHGKTVPCLLRGSYVELSQDTSHPAYGTDHTPHSFNKD